MKNIVEKLGIEPIDETWFVDIDHVLKDQVRKVEEQRNYLLKALMELNASVQIIKVTPHTKPIYMASIVADKIIEEVTGKTYEEIEGLK